MMKWFIGILFTIILFGLALVSAATTNLEIQPISINLNGNPGQTIDVAVQVKNIGTDTVQIVRVSSSDLEFGSNKINAPPAVTIASIAPGQTKTGTLRVTIPSILSGAYVGTISVIDANDNVNPAKTVIYTITVNAVNGIDVLNFDQNTKLEITGQEDEIRSVTFQIKNTGSTTYTLDSASFTYNPADFSDGDKSITLSFTGGEVKPGENKTITLTADIDNGIDVDTYEGLITVKSGTATDTFKLSVVVSPEVCEDGPVGDELRLDVSEPDNGDDFAPGDTINIDVNVDNNGDRKDVVVEAFLYNVDEDDEIEREETDSERISSDDDKDFEFDLKIPFDDEISEDDSYILFIKAFEEGDEDKQCAQEQLDIEIKRESHDVRIQNVNIIPSSAKPGESLDVSVNFVNVGSSEEDAVFVRITATELGWDETSTPVDLEDGESKDNDGVARFIGLLIPRATEAGAYSITATVTYDDGDKQSDGFGTLTVVEGEAPVEENGESTLRLQSVSDTGNNAFAASVAVVNDGRRAKTYDLSVDASWAQPVVTQTFTVNGGDSKIVQLLINAKQDTPSGSYSGIISLKEDGEIVDTETFNVAVKGKEPSRVTGFAVSDLLGGTGGTVLFVIVDIILIIIAIFFIRLIFKSGKKKQSRVAEKVKL